MEGWHREAVRLGYLHIGGTGRVQVPMGGVVKQSPTGGMLPVLVPL